MPDSDAAMRAIEEACLAYDRQVRAEFEARISAWPVNLAQQEVHEVVGALLARQITLATEIASSPGMWTAHVGPVLLRAMADVYISLAWILGDPLDRARKFIEYGLGQVKLMLEHRRQRMSEEGGKPDDDPVILAYEAWVESQRWLFLTEVDFGAWSGLSTRQMAEQAGCLNFYNHVYVPFSAATHSTWHHVSRTNLKRCRNALHRFHGIGSTPDAPPDPWNLILAAKYADKALRLFDAKLGLSPTATSAYSELERTIDEIGRAHADAAETD